MNRSRRNSKKSEEEGNLETLKGELAALRSIYDENVLFIDEEKMHGRFLVHVNIPNKPLTITWSTKLKPPNHFERHAHFSSQTSTIKVDHLPPIELIFALTECHYPDKGPPRFLISCKWLEIDSLERLCSKLEEIWENSKMEILFDWFTFLQDETLNYLRIKCIDITYLVNVVPDYRNEYNQEEGTIIKHKIHSSKRTPLRQNSFTHPMNKYSHHSYNGHQMYYRSNRDYFNREPYYESHRQNFYCDKRPSYSNSYKPNACSQNYPHKEWRHENPPRTRTLRPESRHGGNTYDSRAVFNYVGLILNEELKKYNATKQKETFNSSWHNCKVCFEEMLGSDFVQLSCGHLTCKICVSSYLTTLIKDCNFRRLTCPMSSCEIGIPTDLIRELINEELFSKYDEFLLSHAIESMGDVFYCPRKSCQAHVIADKDSKLAVCPECQFAFCTNCKYAFHGIDPCRLFRNLKEKKELLNRYQEAGTEEKLQIEKVYGRKQLQDALNEELTEKWIDSWSKPCPQCKTHIEKIEGCNKMTCWKCKTYFCWICLEHLPNDNPYSHFSNPSSQCYYLLFHGTQLED